MEKQKLDNVLRLKRHIEPSFEMLTSLIDYCPDDMWTEVNGGFSFWQQVYHTLYWCDCWLRENYKVSFQPIDFGKSVSPHLDKGSNDTLTKDELRQYSLKVNGTIEEYFAKLNDMLILEPVITGSKYSYMDAILGQIRHIQYHIGHCNSILRDKNVKAVEWIGFGECNQ